MLSSHLRSSTLVASRVSPARRTLAFLDAAYARATFRHFSFIIIIAMIMRRVSSCIMHHLSRAKEFARELSLAAKKGECQPEKENASQIRRMQSKKEKGLAGFLLFGLHSPYLAGILLFWLAFSFSG